MGAPPIRHLTMSIRKLGILLPGQGFQKVGMLTEFAKAFPQIVNPILEKVDLALPGLKLSKPLIDPNFPHKVTATSIAQPLILATSYAIFETLKAKLPEESQITHVAGHSLGEFSAFAISGILPLVDALKLVKERGLAMEKATENKKTGMVLVVKPRKNAEQWDNQIQEVLEQNHLDIANYNSKSHTSLSGDLMDLRNAVDSLQRWNPRLVSQFLDVSGAFHSRYMEPAQPILEKLADSADWNFPGLYTVVSNKTAKPFESIEEVKAQCPGQLVAPVYWSQTLDYIAPKVDELVSVGPGRIGKITAREYKTPTKFYDEPNNI